MLARGINMSKKLFTQVYDWKTLIGMSNSAKSVFMALADNMEDSNGCLMGSTSLAGHAGLSKSQTNRAVSELKKMGAIEVHPAGRMQIYLLNAEIVWEDKPWRRSEAKIPIMWIRAKQEGSDD